MKIKGKNIKYNTPVAILMAMIEQGSGSYTVTTNDRDERIVTIPMASSKWPGTPPVVVTGTYDEMTDTYSFTITGADEESFSH